MRTTLAKTTAAVAALVAATAVTVSINEHPAGAAGGGGAWPIDTYGATRPSDNVILTWNEQLLNTIRANPGPTGPTITARALGVLNTAMYDAWAAYDGAAKGTRPDGPVQQPAADNTVPNKSQAISYAANKVLNDLFPDGAFHRKAIFDQQLADSLAKYPPGSAAAVTVGNQAADAVLAFRHADGSNQLGTDPNGTVGTPYSDNTVPQHYTPLNTWNSVPQPWHWQPLCVLSATGAAKFTAGAADAPSSPVPSATSCNLDPATGKVADPNWTIQKALTPQWEFVKSFSDLDPVTHFPSQGPVIFQLPGPPKNADGSYSTTDISTALTDTANLTDISKAKAEYWADGPKSEFPPGHMIVFAQVMSRMKGNTLDQDAKLFFAMGNAVMDASISAWAAKYEYDYVRPTTAIRVQYKDKLVTSWLGPNKGYGKVLGQNWQPYQAVNVVTPGFPEYVSGHSTFSAAGRTVLAAFFGSDNFGAKVTIRAGSSAIEKNTPAKDVVLSWKTFTAAADEAGWSRRYGGIHFQTGDEHGRTLGKVLGYNVWTKAQTYFDGTAH
jgi:hypothetical protein